MRWTQAAPAIGAIELYYPAGMRSLAVPAGADLLLAALKAHDIWEEESEQIRVRVIKFLPDGDRTCICHLPPNGGEDEGP